jgi:FMN phosphatase YigB (HAD superfamily)
MVGDNLRADVRGAEAVGIPGILVRRYEEGAASFYPNLTELADFFGTTRKP